MVRRIEHGSLRGQREQFRREFRAQTRVSIQLDLFGAGRYRAGVERSHVRPLECRPDSAANTASARLRPVPYMALLIVANRPRNSSALMMTESREKDAMICRACGNEERASEGYPCASC